MYTSVHVCRGERSRPGKYSDPRFTLLFDTGSLTESVDVHFCYIGWPVSFRVFLVLIPQCWVNSRCSTPSFLHGCLRSDLRPSRFHSRHFTNEVILLMPNVIFFLHKCIPNICRTLTFNLQPIFDSHFILITLLIMKWYIYNPELLFQVGGKNNTNDRPQLVLWEPECVIDRFLSLDYNTAWFLLFIMISGSYLSAHQGCLGILVACSFQGCASIRNLE